MEIILSKKQGAGWRGIKAKERRRSKLQCEACKWEEGGGFSLKTSPGMSCGFGTKRQYRLMTDSTGSWGHLNHAHCQFCHSETLDKSSYFSDLLFFHLLRRLLISAWWEVSSTEPQSLWAIHGASGGLQFAPPLKEDFQLERNKCQAPSLGVRYPGSFPVELYGSKEKGKERYMGRFLRF